MHLHSHLGVYARILSKDKSKILLIKKARGPYTGLYDLPGGSLEENELLEETLVREVKEEVGCDTTDYKQLFSTSTRYQYKIDNKDAILRHVGIIYDATIVGTPKETPDGEDSNGCIWIDIKTINHDKLTPFVIQAINSIR